MLMFKSYRVVNLTDTDAQLCDCFSMSFKSTINIQSTPALHSRRPNLSSFQLPTRMNCFINDLWTNCNVICELRTFELHSCWNFYSLAVLWLVNNLILVRISLA